MQDIAEQVLNFREAARSLWNNYYQYHEDPHFEPVEEWLMKTIVLEQCKPVVPYSECDSDYLDSIEVLPELGPRGVVVMWAREEGNTWEWAEIRLQNDDLKLKFVGFFDWRAFGFRDYQYARARIVSCPAYSETEGADMLIEALGCKYFRI